jgi:hypothetical protein
MSAWNNWYHINGNTYGTWLPGDPRGFRTRHHREHVEGDYKNPPPKGVYDARYQRSKEQMRKAPVFIEREHLAVAGQAFVNDLLKRGTELIALSLGPAHYHLLGRFQPDNIRWPVGLAKRAASLALTPLGYEGSVWAVRCKITPISDREHQVRAFHYILKHSCEGAWTWDCRTSPLPSR